MAGESLDDGVGNENVRTLDSIFGGPSVGVAPDNVTEFLIDSVESAQLVGA